MLLICGIFISHYDFASQRGAGVNTGAGEKILICVGHGGEKRESTVTSQRGSGPGDYFYEKYRHFIEKDVWSTCWLKHSRHSCAMLLSSHSSSSCCLGCSSLASASMSWSGTDTTLISKFTARSTTVSCEFAAAREDGCDFSVLLLWTDLPGAGEGLAVGYPPRCFLQTLPGCLCTGRKP